MAITPILSGPLATERRALVDALARILPFDVEEASAVARCREFAAADPGCFRRETLGRHFTGSCWIVNPARTKALLTHHRKYDRWVQLGGHCDGDPDVLATALREAHEESGLGTIRLVSAEIFDVDVHHIPEHRGTPAHEHFDLVYLMEADDRVPFVVSEESVALGWAGFDDPRITADPRLLRMARKTEARRGAPRQSRPRPL